MNSDPIEILSDSQSAQMALSLDNARLHHQAQEEQQRIQAVLDTVAVPMIISRLSDSKVLYANPTLAQIGHVVLDELIGGRTVDYFANRADRDTIVETLQQQGHVSDFEVQLRRGDGVL